MILLAHGGAGIQTRPDEDEALYQAGMIRALQAGYGEKRALEAVVETICALERDELFNAGRGSVLAADGQARMDASLATSDGRAGAIGDSLLAHSAIRSARLVMERSPHTLLVGVGADDWLREMGATSPARNRISKGQRELWRRWKSGDDLDSLGTVGAVALDQKGRLAAGTSTGGLRGKQGGRVGDSAVHGGGTWCSGECAISLTGDGDTILARSSAARIALDIERGKGPRKTITRELEALHEEGAAAGCIVLLANGKSWSLRNCDLLNRGRADQKGIHVPLATE